MLFQGRRAGAQQRESASLVRTFRTSAHPCLAPPCSCRHIPAGCPGRGPPGKRIPQSPQAPGPSIPSFPADHRAAPRPPEPATPTDPHTTVAEAAKPHQYRSNSQKAPGSRASGVGISTHRDQPGTPCPRLRLTDLSASRSRAASSTALVPIFREIAAWRLRHPHRRNSVATSCAGGPFRAAAREARFGAGTGGSLQAPAREAHFRPRHGRLASGPGTREISCYWLRWVGWVLFFCLRRASGGSAPAPGQGPRPCSCAADSGGWLGFVRPACPVCHRPGTSRADHRQGRQL